MAINTDSLITLESGGVTYGKIGVSKSLNQLSINDIWDAVYCSSDNPTLCEMKATFTGETPWFDDVVSPLTFVERTTGRWNYGNQELCYKLTSGADNTSEQLYGRVVWLYTTQNPCYEAHRCVKSSNASAFKLITQMNVQQFELLENNLSGYSSWGNRPKPSTFNDTNIEFMPNLSLHIFEESDTSHSSSHTSASNIYPFIICKFNDKICLFYGWDFTYWLSQHTKDTINNTETGKQFFYLTTYDGTDFCFNTSMRVSAPFTTYELDQYQDYYGTDINEQHLTFYSKRTDQTNWREFQIAPANKTALNTWISRFGMYFRTDKKYKPIVVNGYVSGFTDDFTIESEIDNYTGTMQHTVPAVSPSGGGGGDDDDPSDDQASGGIYGGAQGMCNLYYMTKDEIKNLQNWFRGTVFAPGIQIPANFDPSNQLIGLMAFPIELGGSVDSTTITFRTADNQAVDTGVSCQRAYGDDLKFDMGTINIPARMQERGVPFLDYSSQIEVYIPFCDVVQLDVQQVIGTTLTCEMWINPATGDVSAMLSSGTHPVAYTSGNCAQQLPISVSSYGAIAGAKMAADNKMTQAVFQAAQNVVKDITNAGAITSAVSNHTAVNGQGLVEFSRIPQVQSNTGLAVGAGIKAAGNVVNTALNLTAQNLDNRYALSVAKNSAPTHVSGSFGACTSWHFPNYCYVKITRPHFKKPDNYGHTEAVPVVATKQLSSLSGLTTCVNPDVSSIGTATMQELETIKSYLMSGVIL